MLIFVNQNVGLPNGLEINFKNKVFIGIIKLRTKKCFLMLLYFINVYKYVLELSAKNYLKTLQHSSC